MPSELSGVIAMCINVDTDPKKPLKDFIAEVFENAKNYVAAQGMNMAPTWQVANAIGQQVLFSLVGDDVEAAVDQLKSLLAPVDGRQLVTRSVFINCARFVKLKKSELTADTMAQVVAQGPDHPAARDVIVLFAEDAVDGSELVAMSTVTKSGDGFIFGDLEFSGPGTNSFPSVLTSRTSTTTVH
jgi:hypothetical protein